MAPQGDASFNFDTNIDETRRQIAQGLADIDSMVRRAEAQSRTQTDFGPRISDLSAQTVHQARNQARELVGQLKAGLITGADFEQELRNRGRRSVAAFRSGFTAAIAQQPLSFQNEFNAQDTGTRVIRDVFDAMYKEVRALRRRPEIQQALDGIRLHPDTVRKQAVETFAATGAIDLQTGSYIQQAEQLSRLTRLARDYGVALRQLESQEARKALDKSFDPAQITAAEETIERVRRTGAVGAFAADPQLQSIVSGGATDAQLLEIERSLRKAASQADRTAKAERDQEQQALKAAQLPRGEIRRQLRENLRADPSTRTGGGFAENEGLYYKLIGHEQARLIKGAQARLAAETAIAAAEERQTKHLAQQNAGPRGSLLQSFVGGFTSRGFGGGKGQFDLDDALHNLAANAGSTAKYTALYSAQFATMAAAAYAVQEALDFADSFTDLSVAMGQAGPPSQEFVNSLSDIAVLSGANAGEALDTAARAVRAFGDTSADSADDVARIGTALAESAAKLALIANKDLKDARGDIIAIGTAFNLTAEGSGQVLDAIAGAKRFGGDSGQISQGLANISISAKEAGFNAAQAANLIGLVISRTDESGQAAATRLTRIFSILSGTTGQRLLATLQIDPTQTIRDQLVQIAAAYEEAGPELQGIIRSQLGGTANLRELLPILDSTALRDVLDSDQSVGKGDEQFRRRATDLVGHVRQLRGELSQFTTQLTQAEIFQPLGAGLVIVEKLLSGVNDLLKAYNELTDFNIPFTGISGGSAIAGAAELGLGVAAVRRLRNPDAKGLGLGPAFTQIGQQWVSAGTAIGGRLTAAGDRLVAAINGVASKLGVAGIAPGVGGRLGSRLGGGLGALGRFALGPGGLAVGTAAVVGYNLFNERRELARFQDSRTSITNRAGGDAESIKRAAADLRSAAEAFDTRATGFTAFLTSIPRRRELGKTRDLAAELDREAAASQLPTESLAVFGTARSTEEIASGFEKIAAEGYGTATQLDRLIEALGGVGGSAEDAAKRLRDQAGAALSGALSSASNDLKNYGPDQDPEMQRLLATAEDPQLAATYKGDLTRDTLARVFFLRKLRDFRPLEDAKTRGNVFDQAETNLRSRTPGKDGYAERDLEEAARAGVEQIDFSDFGDFADEARALYIKLLAARLRQQFKSRDRTTRPLSGAELAQSLQGIADKTAEDLQGPLLSRNALGQEARLNTSLQAMQREIARADPGEDLTDKLNKYYELKAQRSTLVVARLEKERAARQKPGNTRAANAAIGLAVGKEQLLAATEGLDVDRMVDIMNTLTDSTIANIRAGLVANLKSAQIRAANERRVLVALGAIRVAAAHDGDLPPDVRKDLKEQLDKDTADAAKGVAGADRRVQESQAELDAFDAARGQASATGSATKSATETAEDRQMARILAYSRQGDDLAQAQDRVKVARLAVQKAIDEDGRGSVAHLQAIGELRAATFAAGTAVASEVGAKAAAQAARTGGALAGAQAAVVGAKATLSATAKGSTAYYQALAQYYQAQQSVREAMFAVASSRDTLNGDLTDPVEQARDALRDTARRLADAKRRGATDDIVNLEAQMKQQKASLARTQFNEEMNDARTRYELGQLSYSAYTKMLTAQRDRLQKIKKRSHDEQQELYDVERTLKGLADQMQGQFNLGDIQLPTVYQARRAAGGDGAYLPANAQSVNQQITVSVNGADTAAVTRILTQLLGPNAAVNSTYNRKV